MPGAHPFAGSDVDRYTRICIHERNGREYKQLMNNSIFYIIGVIVVIVVILKLVGLW